MKGTKRNTVFGFRNTDLLGIAIMIIPFYISLMSFDVTNRVIPFIPWITKTSKYNINPSLISAFLSAAFYISLIVRYGIFKSPRGEPLKSYSFNILLGKRYNCGLDKAKPEICWEFHLLLPLFFPTVFQLLRTVV